MKRKVLVSICCLAISFTICGLLCSCNSSKSKNESKETFIIGEYAFLKDNCIGVVDMDDWDKVIKFVKADDMTGIRDLVTHGKAITFAAGKQVKVIKTGFDFTQVMDIFASNLLVFVPTNMLTHEDLFGIFQSE